MAMNPSLQPPPGPARWRPLFLVLALVGLVVPWYFNLRYFAGGGGVLPAEFFGTAFANALTTAITLDVYLAGASFCAAVALDRGAGAGRWWAVPATFLVGLSFALPAYLWWRLAPARWPAASSEGR
jgi:hypothetical protein